MTKENILQKFKNGISNNQTEDNVLFNLYLINNSVVYEYNNNNLSPEYINQIIEFGDYFCQYYEELTRIKRLQKYNNSEPLVFKLYMFYKQEKNKQKEKFYDIIIATMKWKERLELECIFNRFKNTNAEITFEYDNKEYCIPLYCKNNINKKAMYFFIMLLRTNGSCVLSIDKNNLETIYGICFCNKQWHSVPKDILKDIHSKNTNKTCMYSEISRY